MIVAIVKQQNSIVDSGEVGPKLNVTCLIELCSEEQRRWRYLGPDARLEIWWCDSETGREFYKSSVMYSWKMVGQERVAAT